MDIGKIVKFNQAFVKSYAGKRFKFINIFYQVIDEEPKKHSPKCSVNDVKLENNIKRAITKIYEYAFCNEWDYFVTLTINKNRYDRYDLKKYRIALTEKIKYYNRHHPEKIKYLLVPEKHRLGGWHLHGLIKGIPADELMQLTDEMRLPNKIRILLKRGHKLYKWQMYEQNFGWNIIEPIRSHSAVSKYITKYIKKQIAASVTELNERLYYVSKGMEKAVEIKRGSMFGAIDPEAWKNDYVAIKWYDKQSISDVLDNIL